MLSEVSLPFLSLVFFFLFVCPSAFQKQIAHAYLVVIKSARKKYLRHVFNKKKNKQKRKHRSMFFRHDFFLFSFVWSFPDYFELPPTISFKLTRRSRPFVRTRTPKSTLLGRFKGTSGCMHIHNTCIRRQWVSHKRKKIAVATLCNGPHGTWNLPRTNKYRILPNKRPGRFWN